MIWCEQHPFRAIGPKKFWGPTPSNGPSNGFAPHQNLKSKTPSVIQFRNQQRYEKCVRYPYRKIVAGRFSYVYSSLKDSQASVLQKENQELQNKQSPFLFSGLVSPSWLWLTDPIKSASNPGQNAKQWSVKDPVKNIRSVYPGIFFIFNLLGGTLLH